MKKRIPNPLPKDTPATRNKRLQQRLQEIDERNQHELNMIEKSLTRIKARFRSKKPNGPS